MCTFLHFCLTALRKKNIKHDMYDEQNNVFSIVYHYVQSKGTHIVLFLFTMWIQIEQKFFHLFLFDKPIH